MRRYLLLVPFAVSLAACTTAATVGERPRPAPSDLDEISAVLKRDFRSRGQATMERVQLDEVQRLCNLHTDNPPAEVAKRVEDAQLKAIQFPSGSLMGDWKNGEKIAQSGRGA